MEGRTVLVTGGAGYIGSHCVQHLIDSGERVVVIDNLSTGFAEAVHDAELIIGDIRDEGLVTSLLQRHNVDTVIHFAAHTVVPESVSDPLKYYFNNTCGSRSLLSSSQEAGVKHFIFSSTAAVYGIPESGFATEETPTAPINPYGASKLMTEWMLRDVSRATDLRYVALRYFNVAGCDPRGRLGQNTPNATLLVKVACEAAVGKRDGVCVFGTDYPTLDGTGIRDYVHVDDLANAHVLALDYLRDGGSSTVVNCGYGHGYSVREVLNAVQHVHGHPLKITEKPRRAGDPPILIADGRRIRDLLSWTPRYDDLEFIVRTSLNWEHSGLPNKPQPHRIS